MRARSLVKKNIQFWKCYQHNTSGQTILEYALVIAVVILVLILSFPGLHQPILDVFNRYQEVIDESAQQWSSTYIVFQEDFHSADNWTSTRGQFDVDEQGRFYNTQNGENRSFMDYQGNDFQMSIDVAHLTEGQGYGVWFRANDIDASSGINGYTFQYDPGYGNGAFLFRKWENGHERSPFGRIDVGDFEWYEEHEITLQVEGNTFTAFVNGEPVITAQDDTYDAGTVGLRTWGSSRAYFDDILIEEH
jgi:Flp pilus assembly pilin Flp